MSLSHCADLVATGDPDRHTVIRAATDAAQARLYPVCALNIEIGRAAWASAEPMVAEMRLQWWRDALAELTAGAVARPHPVLAACGFLAGDARAGASLDALIEARRWDIWREPFADEVALWSHLDATGGGLMGLCVRLLGGDSQAEATARAFGGASALAGWLQAVPILEARGRHPLPDGRPEAIAALARQARDRIAAARRQRATVPRTALPALLTAWRADAILARVVAAPSRVADGSLVPGAARGRGALMWRAVSGRW